MDEANGPVPANGFMRTPEVTRRNVFTIQFLETRATSTLLDLESHFFFLSVSTSTKIYFM